MQPSEKLLEQEQKTFELLTVNVYQLRQNYACTKEFPNAL